MALILAITAQAEALMPENVLVVYNSAMTESKEVAEYYALRRKVPSANLLGVRLSAIESMSREEYDTMLAPAIRNSLKKMGSRNLHRCILLVYGVPLRVDAPSPTKKERYYAAQAAERKKYCQKTICALTKGVKEICAGEQKTTKSKNKTSSGPSESSTDRSLSSTAEAEFKESIRKAVKELMLARKRLSVRTQNKTRRDMDALYSSHIALLGFNWVTQNMASKIESEPSPRELGRIDILRWAANLKFREVPLLKTKLSCQSALELAAYIRISKGVIGELEFWHRQEREALKIEALAAVDSELPLVLHQHYSISDFIRNPLKPEYDKNPLLGKSRGKIVMASRLDGPTPEIAKRLVDDAIETEEKGLEGVFYIDARGLAPSDRTGSYGWYDKKLRKLASFLREKTQFVVKLDDVKTLFEPGSAPEAALYCGWYSLRKYVDAFDWVQGSIGFHIASSEASTLRKKRSRVWCKSMLEKGICATLGPVAEPYLHSFPLPDQFFPLLMTGQHTLAEVYFRTTPLLSWRQVLVGDPLYNPFKKKPALAIEDLPPGLAMPD